MCDITNDWSMDEVLHHPKLSDDYKYKFFEDLANQEEYFEVLNNLGLPIDGLGVTITDLDNLDYIWDLNDDDKGIPSATTQFAEQQKFRVINLYRYISTEYGPSFVGPKTRRFCKMTVSRTNAAVPTAVARPKNALAAVATILSTLEVKDCVSVDALFKPVENCAVSASNCSFNVLISAMLIPFAPFSSYSINFINPSFGYIRLQCFECWKYKVTGIASALAW